MCGWGVVLCDGAEKFPGLWWVKLRVCLGWVGVMKNPRGSVLGLAWGCWVGFLVVIWLGPANFCVGGLG